jgi:beta-1,4-mannosyl-glycoprotein beta-1,4-N-acetylglucosaminyltransferase
MIYDCVTFFNELDLLEIRLHTLDAVVDKFVIAEATRTHTGKKKDLLFKSNQGRFKSFLDKIIYVVVEDLISEDKVTQDKYNLPWINENRQRNALRKGIENASLDDIIMVSDLDEIPNPEFVKSAKVLLDNSTSSIRFEMNLYNYFINFKNFSYPKWNLGTVAVKCSSFLKGDIFDGFKFDRYTQASENVGSTFNKLRFTKCSLVLKNSGWHFSYLGGIDAVQTKLTAFSHTEFSNISRDMLERRLFEGKDLFGRVGRLFGVVLDESFPTYVIENKRKFAHLIFPIDDIYLKRIKKARCIATLNGLMYKMLVAIIPKCLALWCVKMRDSVMRMMRRI